MNFIRFCSLFVILTPIYRDVLTLTEFYNDLKKYEPIVEKALEDEISPSEVLNGKLRYICLSGCYQNIDITSIHYILRGETPLYLCSKYPEKEYIFYRI